MSHKPQKQQFDAKREPVAYDDDYADKLWANVNAGSKDEQGQFQAGEIEQHKGEQP